MTASSTSLSSYAQQGATYGAGAGLVVGTAAGGYVFSLAANLAATELAAGELLLGVGALSEGALAALAVGASVAAPIIIAGTAAGVIYYYYVHRRP